MAMNLGINTKKLYIGFTTIVTTNFEQNAFLTDGKMHRPTWDSNKSITSENIGSSIEDTYIDLGIVTDEREELSVGSIAIPLPGMGGQHRLSWPIGGKVLRISLSGIIPDGEYVSMYTDNSIISPIMHGKSNSSVFKYKMNRLITYQNIVDNLPESSSSLFRNTMPNIVQYRRTYIQENTLNTTSMTHLSKYLIASYSMDFISGTRNIRYSLTLEMTNNTNLKLRDGIRPRDLGDI